MKTWWAVSPKPGNLGDVILPWMMRHDGVEPEYVGSNYCGKVIGIGSTLKFVQNGDEVWTTGAMRKTDKPDMRANFRALRGPITADICGVLGKVPLGDGALCLPRYYKPEAKTILQRLCVAHYVDMNHPDEWPRHWHAGSSMVITTITDNVTGFIDIIRSATEVESSSLHGGLIAAAYGIPFKFVKIGNRLNGAGPGDDLGIKFKDALEGIKQCNVDDLMGCRPWIKQ